jgi:hypothetical protein
MIIGSWAKSDISCVETDKYDSLKSKNDTSGIGFISENKSYPDSSWANYLKEHIDEVYNASGYIPE